jgi:hypothetical protein
LYCGCISYRNNRPLANPAIGVSANPLFLQSSQSLRCCSANEILRPCSPTHPVLCPHSTDDVGERMKEPKKRLGRCYRIKRRIIHQNEAVPLPRAPKSHPPYGSMPWRKHRRVSAAQGHGGGGMQAEMCGGWHGKGRHGDGRSHKADAHQSHSLPKSHCGGKNNGIHHQKWDWASPSPITLVYTPKKERKSYLFSHHRFLN